MIEIAPVSAQHPNYAVTFSHDYFGNSWQIRSISRTMVGSRPCILKSLV